MKAMLIAALMALTPVSASAQTTHIPMQHITVPTEQQLEGTANVCIAILSEKATPQEVIDKLNLDTQEKQQSLVTMCLVYLQGVQDGMAAAGAHVQQDTPTT
jgi:hypothetical protein